MTRMLGFAADAGAASSSRASSARGMGRLRGRDRVDLVLLYPGGTAADRENARRLPHLRRPLSAEALERPRQGLPGVGQQQHGPVVLALDAAGPAGLLLGEDQHADAGRLLQPGLVEDLLVDQERVLADVLG